MVIINNIKDSRITVDIILHLSFAEAVQLNSDGSYEKVTYMTDDIRDYANEAIVDANEEQLETYRKYKNRFKIGDKIKIVKGRKMVGEEKIVNKFFTYRPNGTYGDQDIDYLVFTDGTKVNKLNCVII